MNEGRNGSTGKWLTGIVAVIAVLTVAARLRVFRASTPPQSTGTQAEGKELRLLYVDSYHPEYPPNVEIRAGFEKAIEGRRVKYKYVYLDAKRKKSEAELVSAATKAKGIADSWKPDVIIASDDAASKYLIAPHYKSAATPVVFVGVNWSAEGYGFPYSNVTGQVEVELIEELIAELATRAKGRRLALLAGNTLTDRRTVEHYRKILGIEFDRVRLVDDFRSWKEAYLSLQSEADVIILRNNAGIAGWSDEEAKAVVLSETRVPTGTVSGHLYPFALIGLVKVNREFGEYAGRTALKIADGTPPSALPITKNAQARAYLNMRIAKKLGIKFPMDLIEQAHLISAEQKRVLYVNSYHQGWPWSDELEQGLLKALAIERTADGQLDASRSSVTLKIVRMDTLRNTSTWSKKAAGKQAKKLIDSWKPDLIVVSDDNAARYLVVPYCMTMRTPIVFCGLNWDASEYGFPTETITGVLEVNPVEKTVSVLKSVAKGERVGILGAKNETNEKEVKRLQKIITIQSDAVRLVSTFDDWKREYLWMQENVDMFLLLHTGGIKGWDDAVAEAFVLNRSLVPTGCCVKQNVKLALLGNVKIAEEQGWEAGRIALEILEGTSPADIPVRANKGAQLYLNMVLAKRTGVKFSVDLLKEATLVGGDTVPGGDK